MISPNQPFIAWFPEEGLWVAWRYGYIGTGDDHFEAAEMWAIIYTMEEKC